jgi:MarR family transcriptional regulator, lower aerobic nicotinate degradation pathway regulator
MTSSRVPAAQLPESLTKWPGYLLDFIAEHTRARFERTLASQHIQSKHASVLLVIDAEGPMSQRDLGSRLQIDKSPMVGLLDDLERLRYAERKRGRSDRRVQTVHLTERGRAALEAARAAADAENALTFGVLDEDEQAQLHELLLRVAEDVARR